MGTSRASNNILRRIVAWQSTTTANFTIMIRGSGGGGTNNLIEDSAFFGTGRKTVGFLSSMGMNTRLRRVWVRWEGMHAQGDAGGKVGLNTTYNNFAPGAPPSGTRVENGIATWTGERGCTENAGQTTCTEIYGILSGGSDRGTTSRLGDKTTILGSLAYLKRGASFTSGHIVGAMGAVFAGGLLIRDSVSYVVGYPSMQEFRFSHTTTNSEGSNLIGIGGTSSFPGGLAGSNRYHGSTLEDVPNPYIGIGGAGPLCFRYVNGVKTDIPLWPWPMDQRIKVALALAGSSPLAGDGTVTGEVESLLGPIPDKCKQ
jgi:hypothetical protein